MFHREHSTLGERDWSAPFIPSSGWQQEPGDLGQSQGGILNDLPLLVNAGAPIDPEKSSLVSGYVTARISILLA